RDLVMPFATWPESATRPQWDAPRKILRAINRGLFPALLHRRFPLCCAPHNPPSVPADNAVEPPSMKFDSLSVSRFRWTFVVACALWLTGRSDAATQPPTLAARLDEVMQTPDYRQAQWGMLVV